MLLQWETWLIVFDSRETFRRNGWLHRERPRKIQAAIYWEEIKSSSCQHENWQGWSIFKVIKKVINQKKNVFLNIFKSFIDEYKEIIWTEEEMIAWPLDRNNILRNCRQLLRNKVDQKMDSVVLFGLGKPKKRKSTTTYHVSLEENDDLTEADAKILRIEQEIRTTSPDGDPLRLTLVFL
jgi:hypothetical protein